MGRAVSESHPTEIGKRIKALRESAVIDQLHLSDVVGHSKAVVYQIERGVIVNPSASLLILLADALGTTAEYLCFGRGEAPSPEKVRAAFIRASEGKQ